MTKLYIYIVASIDEKIGDAFPILRTLDELKARELRDHLHAIDKDYKDVQVFEHELDEPVYLLDVKFPHTASRIKNVVEVGEPEADEDLKEAIIYKKTRIA